ncbi:cytochrome P450 [Aulographum hederae CBS 113979]|uniref:Cytochrome P450 n=1 Tax=Aulographum hederae CBS 113979 TaxID=1176131 RepID=A0A6G1HFT5_9PEZI|nr:cytochrome P450 [Aulographum hederae CBS 113979]
MSTYTLPIAGLLPFPTLFHAISMALSSFVIYWISWIVYSLCSHPLHSIPGPLWAKLSRTRHLYQIYRGDFEKTQIVLHRKHGRLVRIAPDEITCSDPEMTSEIYAARDPWSKSKFNEMFNVPLSKYPANFPNTDELLHTSHRKIVNAPYNMSSVLTGQRYVDTCMQTFLDRMDRYAQDCEVVDLGEWLQFFTFDVVGELFFSSPFGFMDEGRDCGDWIASIDLLMGIFFIGGAAPWYMKPFVVPSAMVASKKTRRAMKGFTAEKEGLAVNKDMLEKFFAIKEEKGEQVDFLVPEIEGECFSAIFARSDSTAIALRAILYYTMKDSSVYSKLIAEIDQATASGIFSDPVQFAEAIQLPYLDSCAKEAMRLFPSVAFAMPRVVPRGGALVSGSFISGGYVVGMNAAVVHLDKDVFGEDADIFRPERWLEEEDAGRMMRYMLHFGQGKRSCTGKNTCCFLGFPTHAGNPDGTKNYSSSQNANPEV